jgi:hypothetical protein
VYLNTPATANGIIQIDEVRTFLSIDTVDKGDKIYVIPGSVYVYVNPVKNEIFDVNRFDGSAIGPIGTLK